MWLKRLICLLVYMCVLQSYIVGVCDLNTMHVTWFIPTIIIHTLFSYEYIYTLSLYIP